MWDRSNSTTEWVDYTPASKVVLMLIDVLVTKNISIKDQERINNNDNCPMLGQIGDKDKELLVEQVSATIDVSEEMLKLWVEVILLVIGWIFCFV